MPRVVLIIAALALLFAQGKYAWAETACGKSASGTGTALRVVMLSDRTLAWPERVQGQLSDLDVEVASAAQPADSGKLKGALEDPSATAGSFVVWVSPLLLPEASGSALQVHVWTRSRQREFVETLSDVQAGKGQQPEASQSALFEAVALYVRSVVKAELSACDEEQAREKLAAAKPEQPSASATVASETFPVRIGIGVHADYRLYASHSYGAWGLGGSVGLALGKFGVQLGAEYQPPSRQQASAVTLVLEGYRVSARAEYWLFGFGAFELGPSLILGMDSSTRHSVSRDVNVLPTEAATRRTLLLGLGVLAKLNVSTRTEVRLGGYALYRPLRSAYRIATATSAEQQEIETWPLEAAATLGWAFWFN